MNVKEDILGNHVQNEILHSCALQSFNVEKRFLAFYVGLMKLNPKWGLSADIVVTRRDIEKFVKHVIDHLSVRFNPDMIVLHLQFIDAANYRFLDELRVKQRRHIVKKLNPIEIAILEPTPNELRDLPGIYRKVMIYIILISGMGDPRETKVMNEMKAALSSFWEMGQIIPFSNLPYALKLERLLEIVSIASGIRLYNLECRKGGEGIQYLPELLIDSLTAMTKMIKTRLSEIKDRRKILRNIVKNCYRPNNTGYRVTLEECLPEYATPEDLQGCKQLLKVYVQYITFLEKFSDELKILTEISKVIKERYNDTVRYLHSIVVPNVHLRNEMVFPDMKKLYHTWRMLQDRIVVLLGLKHIYQRQNAKINLLDFNNNLTTNYVHQLPKVLDADAREFYKPVDRDVSIFDYKIVQKTFRRRPPYMFKGYCCWMLLHAKGALIMGEQSYGIAKYQKNLFIFSSPLAMKSFIRDPPYYISRVLELARNDVTLINILDVKGLLVKYKTEKKIATKDVHFTPSACAETQCDPTMMSPRSEDAEYMWNVWDMKRQALKMADVSKRTTNGIQIEGSCKPKAIQIDAAVDVRKPKDAGTQCKSDNYANTPKPLAYVNGLRGRRDDKQETLDTTYYDLPPRCEAEVGPELEPQRMSDDLLDAIMDECGKAIAARRYVTYAEGPDDPRNYSEADLRDDTSFITRQFTFDYDETGKPVIDFGNDNDSRVYTTNQYNTRRVSYHPSRV